MGFYSEDFSILKILGRYYSDSVVVFELAIHSSFVVKNQQQKDFRISHHRQFFTTHEHALILQPQKI